MDSEVSEAIVATNATADGEATSMYLSRLLASWYQGHASSTRSRCRSGY